MKQKTTTTLEPSTIEKVHEAKVEACTRFGKFVSLGKVMDACVSMADMDELMKNIKED